MYINLFCHKLTYHTRLDYRISRFHFVFSTPISPSPAHHFHLTHYYYIWHAYLFFFLLFFFFLVWLFHSHTFLFIYTRLCVYFLLDSIRVAPNGICHLTYNCLLTMHMLTAWGLWVINKNPFAGNVNGSCILMCERLPCHGYICLSI